MLTVHRRLLRRAVAEAAGAGVLLTGAMALAGRILLPQTTHLDALLAGVMVGAAFAMVRYVSRRPDPLTAAIACDHAARTPELFSTAWSLPASGQGDPAWQQTILAHAAHALSRVDIASILRGRTHPGRLIVGLMLLLSATLWPGQTGPSNTQPPVPPSPAFGGLASLDERNETFGTAAWAGSAPPSRPSAGETSRTGGPEMITPADTGATLDANARRIGDESGSHASAGRGAGAGLAKGRAPSPLDLSPAGKRASPGATTELGSGDGTGPHVLGNSPAVSGGRVAPDTGSAGAAASLSAPPTDAAGPTAAEVASTPAVYRAAVREYFNR